MATACTMKLLAATLFLSILACGSLAFKIPRLRENPEVHMDVTEMITSKGYPCENYWVTTEDGYILNLQRIPHGLKGKSKQGSNQPVAFLQHALLSSAADYVVNLQNESLAFLLADSGADVWLANSRGNDYSMNHTSLDPRYNEFWDFRWDDMAALDLPTSINFVLNQTGAQQLHYVGYSQGSTIAFARFSEDPELAKKVNNFIALAPVARVGHITSPLRFIAPLAEEIELFLDLFGHGAVVFDESLMEILAGAMCEKYGEEICMNAFFVLMGFDADSFNMSRVDVYMAHMPSSTSAANLMQWAQGVNSGKFQHFDYGRLENMRRYGQETPPEYHPSNITIPVTLVRGDQDYLAQPADVDWLLDQIKDVVVLDIEVPYYNHLDPTLAMDVATVAYKKIIPLITGD